MASRRFGLSMLELLVVLAIFTLLIAMLLAAVQKVRAAATLAQSKNNLRQIIIGFHSLSASQGDKVGQMPQANQPRKSVFFDSTVHCQILPWVYGQPTILPNASPDEMIEAITPSVVPIFRSAADPTLGQLAGLTGDDITCKTSYTYNMMAFDTIIVYQFSIGDGTANTVAFTESYFVCGWGSDKSKGGEAHARRYETPWSSANAHKGYYRQRRPTFADIGWGDVMPTTGPSGKTIASVPNMTFQHRPKIEDSVSRVPQTPHYAGLPVALFDGSVRTLSPGIDESVFWSLVSPAGGEVVSLD